MNVTCPALVVSLDSNSLADIFVRHILILNSLSCLHFLRFLLLTARESKGDYVLAMDSTLRTQSMKDVLSFRKLATIEC